MRARLRLLVCLLFMISAPAQGAESLCALAYTALYTSSEAKGAKFLLSREQNLHLSPMVQKVSQRVRRITGKSLQKPKDRVVVWLEYLDRLGKKSRKSIAASGQIREIFHKQFLIKPGEVPESFFLRQARLARARGQGNAITESYRRELTDQLIEDQRVSLDTWVDYFLSPDSDSYPTWAKHWALAGMAKLSKFNPELGIYSSRSAVTVAPFPELNREALAHVMDALVKKVNGTSLEDIRDPELLHRLDGANFGKLYAHAMKTVAGGAGQFLTTQGRWVKFWKGTDHLPLVKSLEGKNTGWCTAGQGTAQSQLKNGDFYVYYSLNKEGIAAEPRLAIRMEGQRIAEVRGVAKDQNLDPQIAASDVLSKKMEEFGPEGKNYAKKSESMKKLTELDAKHARGEVLSEGDLRFLYEIDEKIVGFGYDKDERIAAILAGRDKKQDLSAAFGGKYTPGEISLTAEEAIKGKSKFHYGDLNLDHILKADKLRLPEEMRGSLTLAGLKDGKKLRFPNGISSLHLPALETADEMVLPDTLRGYLSIPNLRLAKGLKIPEGITSLSLPKLESLEGITLPPTITGSLSLDSVKSLDDLEIPEGVTSMLNLNSLTSPEGLKIPGGVKHVELKSLRSLKGLVLPEGLLGRLDLSAVDSVDGFRVPDGVTSVNFESLEFAKDLILPEILNEGVSFPKLKRVENLKIPENISSLNLPLLQEARRLVLPKNMEGNLFLNSLRSAKEITLPETVGSLSLDSLESADGLILPKIVKGSLTLKSLKSQEGVKMPDRVDGLIQINGKYIADGYANGKFIPLEEREGIQIQ